jgi:hypothetical protein
VKSPLPTTDSKSLLNTHLRKVCAKIARFGPVNRPVQVLPEEV